MSRRSSRSEGTIVGREELSRADFVWRGVIVEWVCCGVGRGGRVEGKTGIEWRPMYEN